MPEARAFGPVRLICRAKSCVMMPIPRVRSMKIGFAPIMPSYSSRRLRMYFRNFRVSPSKPAGMSSATPPTCA